MTKQSGVLLRIRRLAPALLPQQGQAQSGTGTFALASVRRTAPMSSGGPSSCEGRATIQVATLSVAVLMKPHPPSASSHRVRHTLSEPTMAARLGRSAKTW